MPSKYYDVRDTRPRAAPPKYSNAQRQAPQRTPVRKVVDSKGNKYLVREVLRDPPFEPVREHYRSHERPYKQQYVRHDQARHSAPAYSQPQRQPAKAYSQPQHQPGYRERKASYSEEIKGHDANGAGSHYQREARHYQPQQHRRSAPPKVDPRLAAERARREAKKQKYLKWLAFFIS